MTILSGEVTKAEGENIISEMNIEPIELFQVLTDEEQDHVVTEYNTFCHDWGEEPVDDVTAFPDRVYEEWGDWLHFRDPELLAVEVLEEREQKYVHISDRLDTWNETIHTVIEVIDQ